nr:MAG TPA: hypothetical protein [Bacteriophage sp.]
MRRSKFYNMRLPERGAREGEANDAADIEDLTYDLGIIDAEMERQRLEDVRLEKDKATKLEMSQHKSAAVLDHPDGSVTDAKLGQRTVLTTSGPLQILLTAIGNAVKAISGASTWNGTPATTLKDAKTHMDDAVKHITAQEREGWNAAATDRHSHTNKSVLDGITAAMVTAWNTVSSKLPLAGGTLTGFLTLHAAPATDMHAATKKYVDDKMAASGSGDMTKAVYDPGGRELPYIPKQDVDALAWGGDFGASGAPVSIAYAGANRIASITAYGENAQGGTTEAPVALTGVDSVQVCGKNMLPNKAKTNTVAGITYTVNPDKSVTAKGTATSWSNIVIDADFSLPAGTYTLNSNIQTAGVNLVIGKDTSGKKNIAVSATASKTFTLSDSIKHCVAYIAVAPDSVVDTTIRPMLNLGKTAMPYEPYKGSVTPIPIPRPLRRVGDVKDKCVTRQKHEGAEKLVVTYNVGYIASYAGESITTAWISSTGALSTGAEVAYVLSSPEVYATDPLDIDNAAGPLTVMTGGELEVRMTELVGSRTYDADGDGVVDRANSVDGGTY